METLTPKIDRYEDYAQMGRYVYFGVNVPIAEHFFESQDVSLEPIGPKSPSSYLIVPVSALKKEC